MYIYIHIKKQRKRKSKNEDIFNRYLQSLSHYMWVHDMKSRDVTLMMY